MEPAGAAGSHYDPDSKKSHKGPQGTGHKGDLPALTANAKGVNQTVTAPKLKLADVKGRALVIHEGGDNYTDTPENGGGKGRIACGVVPQGWFWGSSPVPHHAPRSRHDSSGDLAEWAIVPLYESLQNIAPQRPSLVLECAQ